MAYYNLEMQGLFHPKYYTISEYIIYYGEKKSLPKISAAICPHYLCNHSHGLLWLGSVSLFGHLGDNSPSEAGL